MTTSRRRKPDHDFKPHERVQIVDPATGNILTGTTFLYVDQFYGWVDVLLDNNGGLKCFHFDRMTRLEVAS